MLRCCRGWAWALSSCNKSSDVQMPMGPAPAWCEVGAFYWTVLAPDIVNLGREEQGSVSV
jgi:hypothetical protein